ELHEHLNNVGDYCRAQDLVDYCAQPEVLEQLGCKKTISLSTAQKWMQQMDYRWMKTPKGQYVDGHEREDVVHFRQNKFLPALQSLRSRMQQFASEDGASTEPPTSVRPVVVWYHDESTFYAHDRRTLGWFNHQRHKILPQPKGEGVSLMVADFVSADYGWLCSPDGKKNARVYFKAGKNRDGYFDNQAVLDQTAEAIDLVKKYFPDKDHVFVFDNATTHTKRPDDAITAIGMTVGPSDKVGREVNQTGRFSDPPPYMIRAVLLEISICGICLYLQYTDNGYTNSLCVRKLEFDLDMRLAPSKMAVIQFIN
ncbi:hypothetical protein DL96DRAFT_1466400, partial [Flagelloscypha sp. PMI_526]